MSKLTEPLYGVGTIGPYSFEEFRQVAAAFHGTASPGIMLGGFMVDAVRQVLPRGILFDALVETMKCLPDAVQLLTPPTYGNGWMQVRNLGRFSVSLYDKFSGEGARAWIDPRRLGAWPELRTWYLKTKPKPEQDRDRLFAEIKAAGRDVCRVSAIRLRRELLGRPPMGLIGICPVCGESYPLADGPVCRGCAGQSPYAQEESLLPVSAGAGPAAPDATAADREPAEADRDGGAPCPPADKPAS